MKRNYRVVSLLLALIMAVSFLQIPAAAATDNEPIESAFTDPIFLKAVRETIGKTNGEHIYRSDVEGVTKLEVLSTGISYPGPYLASTAGIEYFTGLKEFYCYFNDLVTLDLSHNPKLEILDCSYSDSLESLDVSKCPELRLLDCNYSGLLKLDVSKNPKLTRLVCYESYLEALDISNNPLLEILDAWGNRLTTLDVSKNPKLEYLDCCFNQFSSLESVTGLENCTVLEDGSFLFEPQFMDDHNWELDKNGTTLKPTCTQKGKKTYICRECGETKIGDVAALGHDWGAWTITAEPSLTATGTAERVCNRDKSHKESVLLPVLTDTAVWTRGKEEDGLREYTSLYGTVSITPPPPPSIGPPPAGTPEAPKMLFADVNENAWFSGSVKYVYEQGLMAGTDKDRFSPEINTSRAMIAAILWRMAGSPAPTEEESHPDCDPHAYYAQAVAWGTEHGVLAGYGGGLFGPNDSLTREQLAAVLYRYAGMPETGGDLASFRDGGQAGGFAESALCWAVERGVLRGKGNGILDPKGKATRAETAAVIQRFLETVMLA